MEDQNLFSTPVVIKRPKTSFDLSDVSSIIASITSDIGKFRLFKDQPGVYLSKITNHLNDTNSSKLDDLVNSFFYLLNEDLHEWYFNTVYKNGLNFDEFKIIFVEAIQLKMYDRIRSISYPLEKFLDTLDLNEIDRKKRFHQYFSHKCKLLNEIFQLNDLDSKLLSLSFLNFEDYGTFLPVIPDPIAFNSLIKVKDSNQMPFFDLESEDSNGEDANVQINQNNDKDESNNDKEELNKKIEDQDKTINDLQLQNNKLSDENLDLNDQISKLTDKNNKLNSDLLNLKKQNKQLQQDIAEQENQLRKQN